MRFSFFCGLSASLLVSLVGCGSSSSGDNGETDASLQDAANGASGDDSGGADGSGSATDAGTDAPSLFDAAPVCPGKGAACESCCDSTYPAGASKFNQITLQCACVPIYCGPLDGGSLDAGSVNAGSFDAAASDGAASDASAEDAAAEDAAVYGVGACAATCTVPQEPNDACNTCIRTTLGSESSPGPCGADILADCVTDLTCRPYFDCVTQCE